jgi:signal transduction histidine kinase/GAF domain-containing protein
VKDSVIGRDTDAGRSDLRHRPGQLGGYVFGLGAAGLVTLLALTGVSTPLPALLYLAAISAATIAGGLLPGLATAAASFVAYVYFFAQPRHSFSVRTGEPLLALVVFAAAAVGASFAIARERRLRGQAQAAIEKAQAAVVEARDASLQTRRLEAVASALLKARTAAEVLEIVMTEGVYAAEARAGVIALLTPDGTALEIAAHRGYPEGRMNNWMRFPVDGPLPMSEAVRTGEPIFLTTTAERDERFPTFSYLREESHALVCLPLRFEDRIIGGMALTFGSDQEFPPERQALKVALAAQAANALERARLDEAERAARERLLFLSQASATLSSSLDSGATLRRLAELAVPEIADWCVIDMLSPDGAIERVALAHRDPAKVRLGWEYSERYPTNPEAQQGIAQVIRSGQAQFTPEIPEEVFTASSQGDEERVRIVRELGLTSAITAPLVAREHVLGALTLLRSDERHFTEADLDLALELARRAAVAVDNARLREEVEQRADAARALRHVAEAVVLVDHEDTPRYWNEAASELLGEGGAPVSGWVAVARALHEHETPEGVPVTVPVELGRQERWLQVSCVRFDEGSVYAVRDVTEERQLERTRSEFVATASHELRTPIATVYGTFQTLLREDIALDPERQRIFLQMGLQESERLARVVDDLLLAGQLDGGKPRIDPTYCDLRALVLELVETMAARANGTHTIRAEIGEPTSSIRCDPVRLRQVLANLIENAIKYSPGGGTVTVAAASDGRMTRIGVADTGIGIPERDQARIFERFVRLDPALSRGVGGTGLGLYICRELVERMGGRISVRSQEGVGSTFTVELPTSS